MVEAFYEPLGEPKTNQKIYFSPIEHFRNFNIFADGNEVRNNRDFLVDLFGAFHTPFTQYRIRKE